jgi:sodium pump decarboxylase gamma subunit
MAEAGLNTLMGMAVVFSALIFISLVIRLFGLINVFQAKKKDKKEEAKNIASVGIDNAVEQIAANEENLADDLELVAVITAAIAAFEGSAPSDGLVVRSIRRRK